MRGQGRKVKDSVDILCEVGHRGLAEAPAALDVRRHVGVGVRGEGVGRGVVGGEGGELDHKGHGVRVEEGELGEGDGEVRGLGIGSVPLLRGTIVVVRRMVGREQR